MPRILACIVLYNTRLEESSTYRTLRLHAACMPDVGRQVSLFVADNSTEPSPLPVGFSGVFLHDGANAGLAKRYNQALEAAGQMDAQWLLTLDQDTVLTHDYLAEMLRLTAELGPRHDVAVIVPKLVALGKLYSPHTSVYRASRVNIHEGTSGIPADTIFGFNSAAAVRVSALKTLGGYDERYWLDYLDHATFAALQRRGKRMYVMHSTLVHELAQAHGEVSAARAENIHRAEQMFYTEHSHGLEWLGRKIDILRQVIGHGRRGRLSRAAERFRLLIGKIP